MVHIGKEIKRIVEERRLQVQSFALSIHKSRENVYNIFQRQSLDTDLLLTISKALDFDFFQYYRKNLPENLLREDEGVYYTKAKELAEKLLNECQTKLRETENERKLMVDINQMLMEKLKKG